MNIEGAVGAVIELIITNDLWEAENCSVSVLFIRNSIAQWFFALPVTFSNFNLDDPAIKVYLILNRNLDSKLNLISLYESFGVPFS